MALCFRVSQTDAGRPPFRRTLRNGLYKNPFVLYTQSLPNFVYNPIACMHGFLTRAFAG